MEKDLPEYELSRKIIGLVFGIYNNLGYGLREKFYQAALEKELKSNRITFSRESYGVVKYKGERIGKYFLDFFIEGKIAVELKVRNEIYQTHVNQLLNYLKSENIKVGLLLVISKQGVLVKRLVN